MSDVIHLDDSRIAEVVDWCASFRFPAKFSAARASFIREQLTARRDALKHAIGV
jgi:hypothetical protein